jgi:hypothetical protein
VVSSLKYDVDLGDGCYSAYTALISKKAVCQAYSLLTHKLLNKAAIENRLISGKANDRDHMWNMVRLDGAWYHLDTTFDDPIPDRPGVSSSDYFNITDAVMSKDHSWDTTLYPFKAYTKYDPAMERDSNDLTSRSTQDITSNKLNTSSGGSLFQDVQPGDWFYDSVMTLANKGMVKGTDGYFSPGRSLSVAEAVVILLRNYYPSLGQSSTGVWYDPYIKKAKELGVISDKVYNGKEDYERAVSRGEFAAMLAKLMESEDYASNYPEYSVMINDFNAMKDTTVQDVACKVFYKGIMTGNQDGDMLFGSKLTRAEACTMIVRLIDPDSRKVPAELR